MKKKRNNAEEELQKSIAEILQVLENQGEIRGFYHWPNGLRVTIGQALKFKRMGMKAGPWDLYIISKTGAKLWMQCKSKKGELTEGQKIFQFIHSDSTGTSFSVVRSVDEAIAALKLHDIRVPDCFVPKGGL